MSQKMGYRTILVGDCSYQGTRHYLDSLSEKRAPHSQADDTTHRPFEEDTHHSFVHCNSHPVSSPKSKI